MLLPPETADMRTIDFEFQRPGLFNALVVRAIFSFCFLDLRRARRQAMTSSS